MTGLTPIGCDHEDEIFHGYVARPTRAGPHPGVLVMHSAHGLGTQVRVVAGKLAALGYVAVIGNMYRGEFDVAAAGERFMPYARDGALIRRRSVAWHDLLAALPEVDGSRTAAIGYCFGGQCVLELARSGAELRAAVSYHGLVSTHEPAITMTARIAIYTGALDPYAPVDHVDALEAELRAAGAAYQMTVFSDAYHGFTDREEASPTRPGIAYDAIADAVSWAGTVALLGEVLAPSPTIRWE